jgi:hypothetical protein
VQAKLKMNRRKRKPSASSIVSFAPSLVPPSTKLESDLYSTIASSASADDDAKLLGVRPRTRKVGNANWHRRMLMRRYGADEARLMVHV